MKVLSEHRCRKPIVSFHNEEGNETLNKKDLTNLIALGEGFTTEFKQGRTSNLGREICSFANATGGVILIGVTDGGAVVGVNDHNRLKSEVQATARSAEPPIAVEIGSVGKVLCVTVPEQNSKPYSFGVSSFCAKGPHRSRCPAMRFANFSSKRG